MATSAAMISVVARACALPRDMEKHNKDGQLSLIYPTMKASLKNVQRLQIILEMIEKTASRVIEVDAEKKKMGDALEASAGELKKVEEKIAELATEQQTANAEIIKLRAENKHLKGATEVKARRVHELGTELAKKETDLAGKEAELESSRKERAEAESILRAQAAKAYQEGVDWASAEYVAQIKDLSPVLYKMGCREALREYGVSEDDPIFANLPQFQSVIPSPESESNSNPPEAPPETSGPPPPPRFPSRATRSRPLPRLVRSRPRAILTLLHPSL